MPFVETGSIKYYLFKNLSRKDIIHGIFTRKGGVSHVPWNTLNVGGSVGDDPLHVNINRTRMYEVLEIDKNSIFDVWQIHSNKVIHTDVPRRPNDSILQGDAIITSKPMVTLFMRFADCVPILLFDPLKKVIGIVHAGWQGTVKKIVQDALQQMYDVYDASPDNIIAGIGPSICPDHYQVGDDVVGLVMNSFREDSSKVIFRKNGNSYLNLWEANRLILEKNGVKNIEVAMICTACQVHEWFSHRKENGNTGRFGVIFSMLEI